MDDIIFEKNNLNINITGCDINQAEMHDKNGILYCEDAVCKPSCPVYDSAICVSNKEKNVNDMNKNICECLKGFIGENCEDKEYINYRYYINY